MKRLGRVLGSLIAIALTVLSLQAVAETQMVGRDFNHMSTGFPLYGGHAAAACETCHMGGVFKGTPRNCDGCHAVGSRIVALPKSNSHIITDAACETCHFNTSTFLGARFNHGTAKTGQCANCHNGRISTGKTVSHLSTASSCDQCHRSSAWLPATWNHVGISGDCVSCHGAAGPGRTYISSTHLSQAVMSGMGITGCNVCHKNFYSFTGAVYDHVGASNQCDTCHGNPSFPGVTQKVSTIHTGTAAMGLTCQACHKNYTSFTGATYDHAGASTSCGTCHGNSPAYLGVKQTSNTIHTGVTAMGLTCQACHKNYTSFTGATYNHAGASTSCGTCHGNSPAYAGVVQKANTIHNVTTAMGLSSCQSCHKSYTSFTGAVFDHVTASACATCHSGAYTTNGSILGMNSVQGFTHVATTAACSTCHTSKTSWLGANTHTGVIAGICGTCHDGVNAKGKSSATLHIPTTGNNCDLCHTSTTSFATWTMNHAGSSTSCGTCHGNSPAYASVLQTSNAIHTGTIAMGLTCQACHKNFTSFTGATYDHAGASTSCGTCHGNSPAYAGVVQSSNTIHTGTTGMGLTCQACHKNYTSFTGAAYDHAGASTSCGNCHGNSPAYAGVVQKANTIHNVTTAMGLSSCQSCHKNFTSFVGAVFDHVTASACATCHSGAYTTNGAILGKPTSHIATTAACSDCHSSKTTWLGALGGVPANHVTYLGGVACATCHTGTTTVLTGAPLHAYLSQTACNSCHYKGAVVYAPNNPPQQSSHKGNVTCSSSSCHKPLGRQGSAFTVWD